MSIKVLALYATFSIVLALSCDSPKIVWCKEISLVETATKEFGAEQWPESWPDKSLSCAMGDYVIVTPADDSKVQHVMLFQDGQPIYIQQDGASSIFVHGQSIVDVADSDDDGTYDRISYTARGLDEWDEISVMDRNLDAQPDIRVYSRPGTREYWLWVENGWYKTPRLGSMEVLVDATPRPYEVVNGNYVFAADEGRIATP